MSELLFEPKSFCVGIRWEVETSERLQIFYLCIPFVVLKISFKRAFLHAVSLPPKRVVAAIAMLSGAVIKNNIARFDSFEASHHFYWVCCNLFPKHFGEKDEFPF
jgi:hypothetical protein